MPGCSAVDCKNRSEDGYMMLVFPRNEERRKLWAVKVNREDGNRKGDLWKPTNYSFLCEKHFADDQWEKVRADGKKKLKCNAVPTIFSHCVPKTPRKKQEYPTCSLVHTQEATISPVEVEDVPQDSLSSTDVHSEISSDSEYTLQIRRLEDFIKKQQRQISVMKKKISNLTLQNSRLRVKLQTRCSSVATGVKKVFNENQILKLGLKKVKWSDDTVQNALQLKFACGSKGYDFLVSHHFPLPSQRTLRRRLQNLNFDSGILHQVFDLMTNKVKAMNDSERDCVLLLDEMSIIPNREFDVATGSFFGNVTLPSHEGIATHACVFMLGGITTRWKQVVAYYFTGDSTNGQVLHDIIIQLIKCSEHVGLHVRCITSDMGPMNQSMWKSFGIISGKNSVLQNYIFNPVNPSSKIYFIADVPHLLKNIKSALLSNVTIKLPEMVRLKHSLPTTVVDCSHIEDLCNLEKDNDLKLAPNLTEDIIKPNKFSKMNVSAARKFLSHETSCGLKFMATDKGDKYQTTAWFVEMMNKWFTLMTSRNTVTALSNINPNSYQDSVSFLSDVMEVFQHMQVGTSGHWKPIQSGLRLSTQSVLDLQNFFLNERGYKFLLTGRLTQDCLENLFSCIRSLQRVPTALQFRNNLKLLCVAQYLTDVSKSSYDKSEGFHLTGYLEHSKSKTSLPCENKSIPVLKIPKCWDGQNSGSVTELSHMERNALFNIAGYIIGRVMKYDKTCKMCFADLASKKRQNSEYSTFVNLKQYKQEKESLLYASNKCFVFFVDMEMLFRQLSPVLDYEKQFNCFRFVINSMANNEILKQAQFQSCHNVRQKLMNRFVRFRLKIYGLKLRKKYVQSLKCGHLLASKTSAMYALSKKVK